MRSSTAASIYNPNQDLDLDEAARAHKHRGAMRIRFKASIHSGSLTDSLNDCMSKMTRCG